MSRERLRAAGVAGGLALFVLVPLGIWAGTSLSDEESADLTVETLAAAPGGNPEIVVSLPSDDLNDPGTVGARSVGLECIDANGAVEFRVEHIFPFTDTDDGTEPPRVHQQVSADQLAAIESCRLDGTTMELESTLLSRIGVAYDPQTRTGRAWRGLHVAN